MDTVHVQARDARRKESAQSQDAAAAADGTWRKSPAGNASASAADGLADGLEDTDTAAVEHSDAGRDWTGT